MKLGENEILDVIEYDCKQRVSRENRLKKYDVNFKIDKIQELWLTLSDKGFLCFDKITNVSVKSKKKQNNMPFNSRARIETALYRIEDTLKYMNTIPLGTNPQRMQAFDFYDFVNCEVVVIDCIEMLGHIFGCESDISKLNLNYSRQSRDSG